MSSPLTNALDAMGGRRDVDLHMFVGDSRGACATPPTFTPDEAGVGRWIYRDNLNPALTPRRIRKENIQGRVTFGPAFARRLHSLTGREPLILNMCKPGACLVKEADDANPDLHWDVTDLDHSLLGALSGQANDRSTILPMTQGLIDLCPGWRVVGRFLHLIMGTWDSEELADGTISIATYVARGLALIDHLEADHVFIWMPVVEGATFAEAELNAMPVTGRIAAVRAAQTALAAARPNIHIVMDIPGQPTMPYNVLTTNPDGSHASGWKLFDGLHEDEAATAVMGITAADAVATILLNGP